MSCAQTKLLGYPSTSNSSTTDAVVAEIRRKGCVDFVLVQGPGRGSDREDEWQTGKLGREMTGPNQWVELEWCEPWRRHYESASSSQAACCVHPYVLNVHVDLRMPYSEVAEETVSAYVNYT